jgi:hypothetical protein
METQGVSRLSDSLQTQDEEADRYRGILAPTIHVGKARQPDHQCHKEQYRENSIPVFHPHGPRLVFLFDSPAAAFESMEPKRIPHSVNSGRRNSGSRAATDDRSDRNTERRLLPPTI